MTPAEALLAMVLHEGAPPATTEQWRAETRAAYELDREVGARALMVSADVDAALLDSMRWYEARLRQYPRDGDCHTVAKAPYVRCDAHGPLQVGSAALRPLRGEPEVLLVGLSDDHLAANLLSGPRVGVSVGYAVLARWKRLCGGGPGVWLTAYGWGRCPPELRRGSRFVDREGARRCALASALLIARGQPALECDPLPKASPDRRFVAWVAQLGSPGSRPKASGL